MASVALPNASLPNASLPDADTAPEALTLADRVFQEIQSAIVKGELQPGAKMSEAELAARLPQCRVLYWT